MSAPTDSPRRWISSPERLAGIVFVFAMLVAAGILVDQVLVPPVVGLADNGDFDRILGPVGFTHQTPDYDARYFRFLTLQYDVGRPWRPRSYFTSELGLAAVARFYALGFGMHGVFDVRFLGALHGLILLAGLALLIAGGRELSPVAHIAWAALLVFVFTDVGYAALLNSFFSTTASLLFFLLLAGVVYSLARKPGSPPLWAAYWLTALLFVTSKPQESVLAPWLALLAILLAREAGSRRSRRAAIGFGAALCVAAAIYWLGTTIEIRSPTIYDHVFLDILPDSRDIQADLRELGLPSDWASYSGKTAYQADSPFKDPGFRKTLLARVGDRQILRFYLRHPGRLAERLRAAAGRAMQLRPRYLGNFAASSGARPLAQSQAFAAWSSSKERLAPYGAWLLPVFWLVSLAGAIVVLRRSTRPRNRCLAAALVALSGMAVTEFLVCALADSFIDLERHLLSFNAMTDLCLVGDLAWIVSACAALLSDKPPRLALTVR